MLLGPGFTLCLGSLFLSRLLLHKLSPLWGTSSTLPRDSLFRSSLKGPRFILTWWAYDGKTGGEFQAVANPEPVTVPRGMSRSDWLVWVLCSAQIEGLRVGEARIPGEKSAAIALNEGIDVGVGVIIYILCEILLKLSLSKESKLFMGLLWVWG